MMLAGKPSVRQINNPDDYSEYLADKGLHEAYKIKQQIQSTHSYPKLIDLWKDHLKKTGEI